MYAIMSDMGIKGSARVHAAINYSPGMGGPKQSVDVTVNHNASGLAHAIATAQKRMMQRAEEAPRANVDVGEGAGAAPTHNQKAKSPPEPSPIRQINLSSKRRRNHMSFKVAPPVCDDDQVDAVMRGIANGCSELYPLPDHPSKVRHLLGLKSVSNDDASGLATVLAERDLYANDGEATKSEIFSVKH